jgi:pilus assembly protein CpaB
MRTGTLTLVWEPPPFPPAAALLTRTWLAANTARPTVQVVEHRTAEKPDLRTVIVAARPLPFGTKLSAAALQERQWPANSVPSGTFKSAADLIGAAGSERVVLSAIAKGEPIFASKITGPGQQASLSVMIDQGKKAVTIRVDDVLGVAGFVQPDDRVDILLTRTTRGANESQEGSAYTDVLLQDIRVLAIDQLADRNSQAKPAKAVTVEVDTADAQKLVLAASIGQLSLALRRAGASQVGAARRIGIEDLLKSKDAAAGDKPVVTVTRATKRTQYQVQTGTVDASFAEDEGEPANDQTAGAAPGASSGTSTATHHVVLPFGLPFGTARADIRPPGIVSPVPQGPR